MTSASLRARRVLADPSGCRPARHRQPAAALQRAGGARAACCSSRARAAGRTSRPGPPPCSRGAIPPARWTRRARCSTGSPPTCRPALRRSRGGLLGSLGYDLARALEPIPQLARDDLALPAHPARRGRLALRVRPRARRAVDRRARRARAAPPARGARARPPRAAPGGARRRAARHALRALPRARRARARPHRRAATSTRSTTRSGSRATVPARWISTRACARARPCRTTSTWTPAAGSSSARRPRRSCACGADGRCETRPIKGTRPRDDDPARRRGARGRSRRRIPKDRAENVMIVDLARNDLSRVCLPGTVRVPSLCAVESHPTVHQLVSTVTGQLAPGRDALDLVAAAFAPGSMTGAPKVRAMQLIEQLEPVRRGPYAGAFGWLAPDGSCDLAVVIRTAVVTRGRAYLHVGGAIVADSDPRRGVRGVAGQGPHGRPSPGRNPQPVVEHLHARGQPELPGLTARRASRSRLPRPWLRRFARCSSPIAARSPFASSALCASSGSARWPCIPRPIAARCTCGAPTRRG